ncbi:beta-galactosidase 7-like protein [Trifolium pratense]|uniref:Beta-galactosidase 7-like protein n=1 Tax=Trifolium pratense TaxID=57577 RepID=A0A2K3NS19_TRIPR|nr:beta-galactosidase 7-like protein [Trifolium pratense]PNY05828.1 beta-galactosidase 7-like protein [Trifolium pratense]
MFNLRIHGIFVIACWTLILFEEMVGGSPLNNHVSVVETSTTGSICGYASEGTHLELKCPDGKVFSRVEFASYGDPSGKCGSFQKGKWHASDSLYETQDVCIGKQLCFFDVSSQEFNVKLDGIGRLAVQLQCDLYDPKISPKERVDKLRDEYEEPVDPTGPGEELPYYGFGAPPPSVEL